MQVKQLVLTKLLPLLVAVLSTAGQLSAATVLYYRMEDGTAGSAAGTLSSSGTSAAAAVGQAGGGLFSADIPGNLIYDPVAGMVYANSTAVETTSAGRFDVAGSVTEVRNFTVEGFIKTSSTAQYARIMQKRRGSGGNASWRLDPRSTTNLAIRADSDNGSFGLFNQSVPSSNEINDGQWHHIALTYTDGEEGTTSGVLRAYFDYQLAATLTMDNTGVMQYDGGPFSFAGAPSSASGLIGLIDEVRFSDTVLAPSQFLVTVPEPGCWVLLLAGGCAMWVLRRFRRR